MATGRVSSGGRKARRPRLSLRTFSIISEIYGRLIDGGTLRRSDAAVATLRAHRSHRSADVLCFKLLSLPLLLLAFFRITVL